ncbi:hypothetical protein L365_04809 [Klebsiella pneumoniae MGH 19]|nr:hypothetical protein L365_04809 [Klebsiella pneumoniae MGH 19]
MPDGGINALSGLRSFLRAPPVGPRKRSAAGQDTSSSVPVVVPDGGINALSGLRSFLRASPVGPRKRSAAGRSGTVPAVVPDGGINALSGLRSLTQAHTPQDRQAQRRRAVRLHTCDSAGWRHKCLIRPTIPHTGSHPVGPRKRSAAGQLVQANSLSSPSGAGPDPAGRGQNSSAPAGSDPDTRPDSA